MTVADYRYSVVRNQRGHADRVLATDLDWISAQRKQQEEEAKLQAEPDYRPLVMSRALIVIRKQAAA